MLSLSISRQNIHPVSNGGVFITWAEPGNTSGTHVSAVPQDTNASMNLDYAAEADVIEALTG